MQQSETAERPGQPHADNRILVISRIGCPPPNRGNRTRMAALLVEMRRLGYKIHFAGVRMATEEKTATQSGVDKWVGDFESPPPLAGFARLRASVAYRVHQLLRRFNFVHDRLDDMFCDHWLPEARALQQRGRYSRVLVPYVYHSKFLLAFPDPCLRILDTIDAFSIRRPQFQAAPTAGTNSRSYSPAEEKRGLLRAQNIIAIQDAEAAYFRQLLGPSGKVYTVGHFTEGLGQPLPSTSFLRLGCIGSSALFNQQGIQWFLREVWPRILARLPGAELWVAGKIGDYCAPAPGLRILGQIPSLADFYRGCPVLINPVWAGSGLKIKTIEALMHGRPVVTTSIGAEGLEAFRGHGLFVGDSAEEFAKVVIDLLSDLVQAQLVGQAALQRIRDYAAESRREFAQAVSN